MAWVVAFGLVAWMGVFLYLDRASIPAYQARNGYRWVALLLLISLAVTTHKALSYRQELRFQIQACR